MAYPTVADAERAGYRLVGGAYGPGAGAHYIGGFGGGAFGTFDAAQFSDPDLRRGEPDRGDRRPDVPRHGGNAAAPEGFAGPNDHWHRHSGVCLKGAKTIFPVDADVTEAQCTAEGGRYMRTTTWMVHAWVVPGLGQLCGCSRTRTPTCPAPTARSTPTMSAAASVRATWPEPTTAPTSRGGRGDAVRGHVLAEPLSTVGGAPSGAWRRAPRSPALRRRSGRRSRRSSRDLLSASRRYAGLCGLAHDLGGEARLRAPRPSKSIPVPGGSTRRCRTGHCWR